MASDPKLPEKARSTKGKLWVALVVSGITLLVVGIVLVTEPIVPQNVAINQFPPHGGPAGIYASNLSAMEVYSPFFAQSFRISWSSSGSPSPSLVYGACDGIPSADSFEKMCPVNGTEARGNTSTFSGSVVVSVANGEYLVIVICQMSPASVTVSATAPTVGAILVAVGIVVVIAGVVAIKRTRSRPPPKFEPDEVKPVPPEPPHIPPKG